MRTLYFLSAEYANILVLLTFEDIDYVAEFTGICSRNIVQMKKEAILCFTRMCNNKFKQEKTNPNILLENMAKNSGLKKDEIIEIINNYIGSFIISREGYYWQRIPRKDEKLTAEELLEYLYSHYQADISNDHPRRSLTKNPFFS